jgi:threonine dehydrogenase-like Zn-dependent dehydrogenase
LRTAQDSGFKGKFSCPEARYDTGLKFEEGTAMKTKALRLYGKNDLRLEEFELPEPQEDEILARVVTDSICMSTYKMAIQGEEHKRVPPDIRTNPIMAGHEFCGELVKIGAKWKGEFKEGSKFTIQTALNKKDDPYAAPGFSYPHIGGTSTYALIPNEVMELNCLLPYDGESYFHGSLSEPMSCIVGAFHVSYHTKSGSYVHQMGTVPGGNMAILAGTGPMGLGAIDYAIHCSRRPKLLAVTDIDEKRLKRAASVYTAEEAKKNGVELVYINTKGIDAKEALMGITQGRGYDDVFVFAPVKEVVELGDGILGRDGCLNFFAGPTDTGFSAGMNFYNVHYSATHVAGNTGGNTEDMRESLYMMSRGIINPTAMITHIGGLDSAADTTLCLPKIPGGKKLIYTHKKMELTAIDDFAEKGKTDPFFAELAAIVAKHNGLWCTEAEKYLLENAQNI